MQWFERISPRQGLLILGVGALGLVGSGLVIQEIYRIDPCPLCIFQRLLYMVFGSVALLAALLPRGQRGIALGLAGVTVVGLLTALYQTIMQAFPNIVTECSYTDQGPIERLVDWLGMQYPPLFLATGFCSSRDWEFLGLSMANWSLVCFTVFGVLVLVVTGVLGRKR